MPSRRYLLLALVLGCGTARAQAGSEPAAPAANRFPQPVRVGDLIGRRVLLPQESQPSLGRVHDVVTLPDRSVAVVIDYGGLCGFFTRPVAVPVEAMALLGEHMVLQDLSAEQLGRAPDFQGGARLAPDAVIRVGLAKPPH